MKFSTKPKTNVVRSGEMTVGDVGIIHVDNEYDGDLIILVKPVVGETSLVWANLTDPAKSWSRDPHFKQIELLPKGTAIQLTV